MDFQFRRCIIHDRRNMERGMSTKTTHQWNVEQTNTSMERRPNQHINGMSTKPTHQGPRGDDHPHFSATCSPSWPQMWLHLRRASPAVTPVTWLNSNSNTTRLNECSRLRILLGIPGNLFTTRDPQPLSIELHAYWYAANI